ncbi:hypothetical protein I3843_05G156300 [Carya illinoinensis]|nr:hypothetical protein I3843_05G156300 [Carya illinoinensis]
MKSYCDASATLVVFERRYASLENYVAEPIISSTEKQPLLETPGEVSFAFCYKQLIF